MSPEFIRASQFVLSKNIEGGLTMDPNDKGNWTGGAVGKGELNGSKYGISAARYPQLDIASLSLEQARAIYYRDYWLPHQCDKLPPKLGQVYFDAVVNMAPQYAVKSLQKAVGVEADGQFGAVTLAAARRMDQSESVPNFLAERAMYYTGFTKFPEYGRGWLERVVRAAMAVA